MKWTTCSSCSRAAGLTLIEVVAAIAILGTILVGIVMAKSRHTAQLASAERRMAAVTVADELIASWWLGEDIPVDQSGICERDESLAWQTRWVTNTPIEQLGARVIRVEMHDRRPARDSMDKVLVTVDLVVPDPNAEQSLDATAPDRGGRP